MKQMILCLITVIALSVSCSAQDTDAVGIRLQQLIERMTSTGYSPFNIIQELGIKSYPQTLLEKVAAYRHLPNPDVQRKISEVYFDYAVHSSDRRFRQRMVNELLESCTDSINTSYACYYVSELLRRLDQEDFDTAARAKIAGFVANKRYWSAYTRLAGFLDLREAIPYMEGIAKKGMDTRESFSAMISLARMHEAPYIKKVTDSLRRVQRLSDLITYHYEDLLYLKIGEVVPLLEKILLSNERDEPLKPTVEGIKYAFSALDILALNVRNFPAAYEPGGITSEEALKKARAWLKLNKNKVRFNTSKY